MIVGRAREVHLHHIPISTYLLSSLRDNRLLRSSLLVLH